MKKKVHIIINPASGREEPILSYISKALDNTMITWDISVTKKAGDAFKMTRDAIQKRANIVAVYGGDGTVMEAAQALYKKNTPLLILPGGTGNVLARELQVPLDVREALQLLQRKSLKIKKIDLGVCDGTPFMLWVSIGLFARVVENTEKSAKEFYGKLAYNLTAIRESIHKNQYTYHIKTEKKEITEQGVSLMIANAGNVGVLGYPVLPNINITDGKLDIILFKSAAPKSFLTWLTSNIRSKKPRGEILHWKAEKISVAVKPKQSMLRDDTSIAKSKLTITMQPQALHVIVP